MTCLCAHTAHFLTRPIPSSPRLLTAALSCAEAGPSTPRVPLLPLLVRRPGKRHSSSSSSSAVARVQPPARRASHYSPLRASISDHPPTYRPRHVLGLGGGGLPNAGADPLNPSSDGLDGTGSTSSADKSAWWDPFKRAASASRRTSATDPLTAAGMRGGGSYEMSGEEEEAAKTAILENVMMGRQPADLQLRCTILDQEGNIKTISGKFRKTDLCLEHKLNPRDLRKIDSRVPNLVPTILPRKDCILVNILHIRALVKADAVLLFDTYGSVDTRLNSVFLYHLEHNLKLKSSSLPYEFRALESILSSVVSALESEMVLTRHLTTSLLSELEDDIDRDRLKRLLHYSRRLAGFRNRAKLVGVALEEVLEQDEDLAAMYLTDKRLGRPRPLADHEELEILLETFAKQVEEIENEASTMMSNVQSTQEIVELILDNNRNALLALDIKVAIVTLGVGIGGAAAALFGMNLRSSLEESPMAFWFVSGTAVIAAATVSVVGLSKLARLRRIGLASGRRRGDGGAKGWLVPMRAWRGVGWGKDAPRSQ